MPRGSFGLTQAVEAKGSIVKEVANVAGVGGHGAEGVGTAGGEGVQADQQHVDEERPVVGVSAEIQGGGEHQEPPHEIPERSTGTNGDGASQGL